MTLDIRILRGDELDSALDAVAELRITVFRDWPYLYDGDLDYERGYLDHYRENPDAIVVGAYDGDTLVGASTGLPLEGHDDGFAAAFAETGLDLSRIFYCAESVLLPDYRGQGAGHAFFDAREAHARATGFDSCCFCAVIRPDDHPRRPATYRPLDTFWVGRGYARLSGVIAKFEWKDIGEPAETAKPLQFWMRKL
ncbi:GNAT family N-acetyltransferase [Sulfitobacter sp. D35]|uniref:GNAT family N-acetyltransferase n=1 Tax=Sulfitobacter sp. D35 TaxID=3083252 RepID=UPI00296F98C1|nr:GNAT family N-acetyltransferase [Sulfitobacter sp. D35]MDW4499721.1 GNAT family N-acetyltransferase [Sulfitobacter sp. D35]